MATHLALETVPTSLRFSNDCSATPSLCFSDSYGNDFSEILTNITLLMTSRQVLMIIVQATSHGYNPVTMFFCFLKVKQIQVNFLPCVWGPSENWILIGPLKLVARLIDRCRRSLIGEGFLNSEELNCYSNPFLMWIMKELNENVLPFYPHTPCHSFFIRTYNMSLFPTLGLVLKRMGKLRSDFLLQGNKLKKFFCLINVIQVGTGTVEASGSRL